MFVRSLKQCPPFKAGDDTTLRELLHPDKAALKLRYSLAHAVVKPGKTSKLHRLRTSEVYYILDGTGLMHIDDEVCTLRVGDAVYIPPRSAQCITNTGRKDLKFICIVDPAWRSKDEIIYND
jgi:mannose-6-phosphate isomerase-like protein (cupin superfamily)